MLFRRVWRLQLDGLGCSPFSDAAGINCAGSTSGLNNFWESTWLFVFFFLFYATCSEQTVAVTQLRQGLSENMDCNVHTCQHIVQLNCKHKVVLSCFKVWITAKAICWLIDCLSKTVCLMVPASQISGNVFFPLSFVLLAAQNKQSEAVKTCHSCFFVTVSWLGLN